MMRAMILAAGEGKRLRPLTEFCPKPLVKVAGKPLIVYHLENLKKAGVTEIVINLWHLGEQIEKALGNGQGLGLNITYSKEKNLLDVGGGICQALPLLGNDPFILVNGDVWTDYPFSQLPKMLDGLAHLVLVDNPLHHPKGDFALLPNQQLCRSTSLAAYTYSGIAVLHPTLFQDCVPGQSFHIVPLFEQAILANRLYGEHYSGYWTDVGSLSRLQILEKSLALTFLERKISD